MKTKQIDAKCIKKPTLLNQLTDKICDKKITQLSYQKEWYEKRCVQVRNSGTNSRRNGRERVNIREENNGGSNALEVNDTATVMTVLQRRGEIGRAHV